MSIGYVVRFTFDDLKELALEELVNNAVYPCNEKDLYIRVEHTSCGIEIKLTEREGK
jgi:hypothetical protein